MQPCWRCIDFTDAGKAFCPWSQVMSVLMALAALAVLSLAVSTAPAIGELYLTGFVGNHGLYSVPAASSSPAAVIRMCFRCPGCFVWHCPELKVSTLSNASLVFLKAVQKPNASYETYAAWCAGSSSGCSHTLTSSWPWSDLNCRHLSGMPAATLQPTQPYP